jgi:hypothetical protein
MVRPVKAHLNTAGGDRISARIIQEIDAGSNAAAGNDPRGGLDILNKVS